MKTANEIYDAFYQNTEITEYIDNKLEFGVDADEDGKYETDNKEVVIAGISEILADKIGVDADAWTDAHGKLCDDAAELIMDYHYDDAKDAWKENIAFNTDPYKYYGLKRSDF